MSESSQTTRPEPAWPLPPTEPGLTAGEWILAAAKGQLNSGADANPPAGYDYYGPELGGVGGYLPWGGREAGPHSYRYQSGAAQGPQTGYWPAYPPPLGALAPPPGPESVATTCTTGLSRESSRDDLTSLMDGRIFDYEERFRVDRRKLELLMLGRFDPIRESAQDYFARIGDETNTTVIWPTRLKIGAKSKKDPHIRIGGPEEGVRRAKYRIMTHLDTKNNRVTMKMDVSYTDHSHVIGKGGNTIRRVMAETGCHIHFPDSNRSNPNEKSNQVSIAGEMDGVETARARVRELTPLIFNFDLPIIPSMHNSPNMNEPFIKAIQDQYNIQVTFRQKQKNFHTTMVVIKGCEWEAARVKEATLLLIDHLCGPEGGGGDKGSTSSQADEIPVSMNMEISPQHHSVVLGKGNMALKLVMRRTNTTILFPDAFDPNIPSIRKGSVTISGSIHNVYLARQQLIGSLPLVMMFDLPDDCSPVDEATLQAMQTELDVQITVKPKARQICKSVTIKAHERNASHIYKARSLLLGLGDEHVRAIIPESYNIQAVGSSLASELGMTLPVHHRPLPTPDSLIHNNNNNNNNEGEEDAAKVQAELEHLNLRSPTTSASSFSAHPNPGAGGGPMHTSKPSPIAPSFTPHVPPPPPQTPWSGMLDPHFNPLSLLNSVGHHGPMGHGPPPPMSNQPMILPPNHPLLRNYALLVLDNITRLQQQQQQLDAWSKYYNPPHDPNCHPQPPRHHPGGAHPAFMHGSERSSKESAEYPIHNNNNNYELADMKPMVARPNQAQDLATHSPPIPGSSPRNSSPVHDDGNLTKNFSKMDLSQGHPSAASSSGIGGMGSTTATGTLDHQIGSSSVLSTISTDGGITSSNNNNEDEAEFKILVDRRAPGCEMKKLLKASEIDPLPLYEKKKLLATKAMQQKPMGELRTPNSSWSGWGFSQSLTESVIREKDDKTGFDRKHRSSQRDSIVEEDDLAGATSDLSLDDSLIVTSSSPKEKEDTAFVPSQDGSPRTHGRRGRDEPGYVASAWGFGNSSAFDALPTRQIHAGEDLPSVFARQGLAKYTDLFLRHEIDLQTFATLSDEELKEIGIQTFGARKKMKLLANKVKQSLDQGWYDP